MAADTDVSQPGASPLGPTGPRGRIVAIDVLRGVALLGILAMNLPATANTEHAFFSPDLAAGSFEGVDWATWFFTHLFFELKMMAIFSMLFGAGLAMIAERIVEKGASPGAIVYRRLLILLGIGLIHAYLIWYGDILVPYAIIGMIVYPLRRLRPGWLIAISVVLLLVAIPLNALQGWFFGMSRAAWEAQQQGGEIPEWQAQLGESWPEMSEGFRPTPEALAEEREAVLGGYFDRIAHRAPSVVFMHTYVLLTWMLWRLGGLMLIGMALFKAGVLTGARSERFYAKLALIGYALGFPIVLLGVQRMTAHEHDFVWMFKTDWHFNYVGSIGVALGHIGLVMLAVKRGWLGFLARPLAAVGRTALSNYLLQSVLMVLIFTGFGLGLFGRFDRLPLLLIVLSIWIAQLAISPWWLSRFRFGPAEWLWRSLTYDEWQPMRAQSASKG